jgi:arylsulfatase A-like enzyme
MRGDDDRELDARTLATLVGAPQAAWWRRNEDTSPVAASTPTLLPERPIVILITVDCLRADVMADAKHAAQLPAMFALRDASVDFTETRATATATAQSVSSIFTGEYYSQLYWSSRPNWNAEAMYPHADATPRFTELLVKGGIRTATVSGMAGLSSEFGVVKGFEEEKIIAMKRGFAHADQISPVVVSRVSAQGAEPLFLYVHYTDAHAPYAYGTAKGSPFEQYMKGLTYVDKAVGELVARVDGDPDLRERTTIVLSADHGEAFGEHRSRYHATTVYEELLRVPLLMRIPGVAPRKVKQPVSLIDLAPTMLDLFGQPTPRAMMGQSLVPFLRGEDPILDRPIIADTSRLQRALIFPDGQKIIHDRRRDTVELFDLRKDPIERRDLFDQSGVSGENRLLALEGFFKAHTLKRPGYKVPYGR